MPLKVGRSDMAWMFWAVIAAMLGNAVLVLLTRSQSTLDLSWTSWT